MNADEHSESPLSPADYHEILARFLTTHSEDALYQASRLSQFCIENGLGPEDIVALHFESLDRVLEGTPAQRRLRAVPESQAFLLDVMIAYGVRYKEYLELKLAQSLRDSEARRARDRERAREAERLWQEKDELLAIIAHELRSPITVVQGTLDLATRSLSRGNLESVPDLLGRAREALDRLSRLTGDLVEASRGRLPAVEKSPTALDPLLAQACAWARPTAASKGIHLVYEHEGPSLAVPGNADALLSILGNLLSNAVRYTPAGGNVRVRLHPRDGWARIEVQDTGIGMTQEVRARLFEKFYRGPEARQLEAHGLGLGLALVQQLVQAHGGQIEVESEPGKGSTFRVLLPLISE
jgi:signal transduction histidine kinase